MTMDGLGEVINRYADLNHELPPGQGPGEDGEEGTGPTPEQIREMHEEERADRSRRVEAVIYDTLCRVYVGFRGPLTRGEIDMAAKHCLMALSREGLL